MNAKHFRDLRAWQVAYAFKLRIYDLIEQGSISNDEKIHGQLREASASAPGQIAEGFGRFDPVDFARFVKMARASLMECQNHLQDAVDRKHITEQAREEHDKLAREALKEIAGLIDYLHSPEANGTLNAFAGNARNDDNVGTLNERTLNREPEPRTRTLNSEP